MVDRTEISTRLSNLNVDFLRKVARTSKQVQGACEEMYGQVNRTPKQTLIEFIIDYHPDLNIVQELIDEHIKPKDLFEDVEVVEEQKLTPKKDKMQGNQMKIDLGLDLGAVIGNAVQGMLEGQREELINKQINAKVIAEIAKLKPTIVKVPERKDVKIEGKQHKVFEEVLFLAQIERQVFIAGPSGSGKTYMCHQVAKALGLDFKHISCSAGLSEAHLLGRMLFDGTYVKSDFVDCYENGGVFLFDEIDAADANTMLVVNSALANGSMSVPNRKDNPSAKRHPDFVCMVAGNTWGNGSIEYAGRNYMDAAFLDRFSGSKVVVDYDKSLEKEICNNKIMYNTLSKLRKEVAKNKIRRVVSTRAFISATRQLESGRTVKQFVNNFIIDWSEEEKRKVKIDDILKTEV
jgi:MoxR-like ATPase